MNEAMVEVGEAEERLNILDFLWCWPILDDLDLGNGMGLWNPRGWQVWVATGMGVGMDFPTHEQQNEPKMSQIH